MRAISSFTLVGELLPPINVALPLEATVLAFGKIPAVRSACALPLSMQFGMVSLGNGFGVLVALCTTPAGATPPGQLAKRIDGLTCAVVGTLTVMPVPVKS